MATDIHIGREPTRINWTVYRNTTPEHTFVLQDTSGTAINLTGASFTCYVKSHEDDLDTDATYTWGVTVTDAANGTFKLDQVSKTDVNNEAKFPDNGWLVLYYTDSASQTTRLAHGPLTCIQ